MRVRMNERSNTGNQYRELLNGLTADRKGMMAQRATIGIGKIYCTVKRTVTFGLGRSGSRKETSKTEGKCGVDEARTRDLLRDRQAL